MVKLRTVLLLIFISCFCFTDVFAAGIGLPFPPGAIKISEKQGGLGLIKSLDKKYESSLDKNELRAFYKQEMLRVGWKQLKGGSFVKDDNLAVIIISPLKQSPGKTVFTISTFKMSGKNSFLAMRKKNPDKLKFMPVYPGSEQVFLWNFPTGSAVVKYNAEGTVKDAVFFYKAGMLNYGWALDSEKDAGKKGKTDQINLTFRKADSKKNETCKIEITEMPSRNKIFISAYYYVHKAFKKIKR